MLLRIGGGQQRPLGLDVKPRSRVCLNCAQQIRQRLSHGVLAGIAALSLLGPIQADAVPNFEVSPDIPLVRSYMRPESLLERCSLADPHWVQSVAVNALQIFR